MSSPTTVPVPIVTLDMSGWFVAPHEDTHVIDQHTLGQIRAAARALGDDTLFARVVQGCELAVQTVSRFLAGDLEHIA
jgi:hypothetical protein